LKKKTTIPLNEIRFFRKLIHDFTDLDSKLKPFLKSFVHLDSIQANLNLKKKHRAILSNVIKEQYDETIFVNSDMSILDNNISKLANNNVYTVTTGHQLNLCVSPLFLIYKITSVIAYANYLNNAIKDSYFVPCFWMASEDHDFDEIKSLHLDGKSYHWNMNNQDAVGNLSSKSITHILEQIKDLLMMSNHGKELFDIYNYAYTNNSNYANATRSVLMSLFGDYGLVVVDGNHRKLKELFYPYLKAEVEENYVYKTVLQTNQLLKANYQPEINAMKTNIFYLYNNIRSKIHFDQNKYFTHDHDKCWSKSELLDEILSFPERFSPNVFLRTLYQEVVMPNLLYIGGPSEVAYWLQLKNMFETLGVEYPLLALRSHFLILSSRISNIMSTLNLADDDLFLTSHDQIKNILNHQSLIGLDDNYFIIHDQFMKMKNKISSIKGFPMQSFYVFEKRFQNELSRFRSKVLKFEKTKNPDIITQINFIHDSLFPHDLPQEKVKSFIPYYIKYGKDFFDLLIQESPIFENKYTILTEEA